MIKCRLAVEAFTFSFCAWLLPPHLRSHTSLPRSYQSPQREHLHQIPLTRFLKLISLDSSRENHRSDVSVDQQPNANSAGKFHSRVGGVGRGKPGSKGKNTFCFPRWNVNDGGDLWQIDTQPGRFLNRSGFVWFICLVHSLSRRLVVQLACEEGGRQFKPQDANKK